MNCKLCNEPLDPNILCCDACGHFYRDKTEGEKYGSYPKVKRKRVFSRLTGNCMICNKSEYLSRHHIFYQCFFPKLRGHKNNMIILCHLCHGEIHSLRLIRTNSSKRFTLPLLKNITQHLYLNGYLVKYDT